MSKFLECLKQYFFERSRFVNIFSEIFTDEELFELEIACGEGVKTESFLLYRDEDEFYIIHLPSGTIINWYKHLGRTNTCNKDGFSEDELREFLRLLRSELDVADVC